MRTTWVWRNGEMIEKHLAGPNPREVTANTNVIGDIKPFMSPISGGEIGSRRDLRDHNKRYGVEQIGNDTIDKKPYKVEGVADDLRRAMQELGE